MAGGLQIPGDQLLLDGIGHYQLTRGGATRHLSAIRRPGEAEKGAHTRSRKAGTVVGPLELINIS